MSDDFTESEFVTIRPLDAGVDPEQKLQWLSAMAQPMATLKIAPINVPHASEIKLMLRRHGCLLAEHAEHTILTFPEGTIRKEIFPRITQARFDIFLPDGFVIRELYFHQKQISYMYLPASTSEIE